MSVFKGSIAEYPGVIVDCFTSFNCTRGRAFFLSHCHKDHMTGLSSPQIVNALQSKHTGLYCSEVTRSLLGADPGFTHLAPYLQALPTDEPVPMTLGCTHDSPALSFTVTLLPAGHCPGSTMFFFEGSNGCVLYTGDFRLTLEETKRLKSIHCGESLQKIKALYLDTTFCHPIATTIPSREVSRGHVLDIAEKWLLADQRNVLHLQLGMFGYEHIYMALAKRFSTKVHIARWRMNAYRDLPAVVECLTLDGESTRIHACSFQKGVRHCGGVPCGCRYVKGEPPQALSIKPSTIWFLSNSSSLSQPFKYIPESNVFRVLHSMHASYTEICDFVKYLRPERIVPCVVPLGDSCLQDVHERLKELLPQVEVLTEAPPPAINVTTPTSSEKPCPHRRSEEYSDDTIDDFASSEERELDTPFTTAPSPLKSFHLPSMLANDSVCVKSGAVRAVKCDAVSGVSSSLSSATLGSLEQTPIDLSPQYCSPSHEHEGSKEREDDGEGNKEKEDEDGGSKKREVASSPSSVKSPDNAIQHNYSSSHETSQNSSCSVNEWHLTLDCSDESGPDDPHCSTIPSKHAESSGADFDFIDLITSKHKPSKTKKRPRTNSEDSDTVSPSTKKLKLCTTDSNVNSDVVILNTTEVNKTDFIDLTQDSSPSSTTCYSVQSSGDTTPSKDNRQSRSLSPFCLPPTPGRETVDSILERSTFLFNPF